jgi:hypothetical protein
MPNEFSDLYSQALSVLSGFSLTEARRVFKLCVAVNIFLTSALVGGEWPASRACRFTPGEIVPGSHWLGDWVDLRTGLDDVEKRKFLASPGLGALCRPAHSQSLY